MSGSARFDDDALHTVRLLPLALDLARAASLRLALAVIGGLVLDAVHAVVPTLLVGIRGRDYRLLVL